MLNPLFKNESNSLEKPVIILAQDNSKSIQITEAKNFDKLQYQASLQKLKTSLQANYDVQVYNFGDNVSSGFDFKYPAKQTDFSTLFKTLKTDFEGKNVGAIIIASDGIINRGTNPNNEDLKAPIYTIALGDTVAKKDLLIANIQNNTLVYLGNQHQIVVNVAAKQAKGNQSVLNVISSDGQKYSSTISINQTNFFKRYTFNINTSKKGIQKLTVSLKSIANETTLTNNTQTVFIDVIDEKQNILIYANAPHPDIMALKQAVESKKSYSVSTKFAGDKLDDVVKYDLIILHQIPSINFAATALLNQISNKPKLFILGAQSDLSTFNATQNLVNVNANNDLKDASPILNSSFVGFTLSDESKNSLLQWPILLQSVNNVQLNGGSALINNKANGEPLLAFATNGEAKTAVLTGEGLWRWRLNNFKQSNNFLGFDELINKTVRYLTANQSKKKFWATPTQTTFNENQNITLEAGLYNDALELINQPDVRLEIQNDKRKKYSFLFSRGNNQYELDAGFLPVGQYSFLASTQLGAKTYSAKGQFVVEDNKAEYAQTTANHQMLYNLSAQSGGKMVYPNQIQNLEKLIANSTQVKTIVHQDVQYQDLINLKWLFFILLSLLSVEWFLRKRNGLV
ncbi:MAG: hypothetical protein EAZ15_08795 [Sphingobacteriales bacterium]|nr:MAG: hypothetical protein EAZ15_08795 [Sphingobacteriales bacterium]